MCPHPFLFLGRIKKHWFKKKPCSILTNVPRPVQIHLRLGNCPLVLASVKSVCMYMSVQRVQGR